MDYIGNFVYNDENLEFIHTFEGRMVPESENEFIYEYTIKDHLGNTRVMFDETGQVLQDQSYYSYACIALGDGMRMDGLSYVSSLNNLENKYLYNGKELQGDFELNWYDYGFRMYDATIGRWHVPDPLALLYPDVSPYQYVHNNPINRIDHFGLYDVDPAGDDERNDGRGEDQGESFAWVIDLDEYEVVAKDGKWYEKVWDIYKDLMNEFSDRLIRSGESFYGDAERDRCISPVRMYQLESTDIRLLTISKGGPSMKSLPTGIDATSKINDMKKYIEKMNKTNASDKKEKNKDSNKENEKSTR